MHKLPVITSLCTLIYTNLHLGLATRYLIGTAVVHLGSTRELGTELRGRRTFKVAFSWTGDSWQVNATKAKPVFYRLWVPRALTDLYCVTCLYYSSIHEH